MVSVNGGTQVSIEREAAPDVTASSESLSAETIFETLSSRRRRYALHYLTQVGDAVSIRELSEQLAAWENGVECDAVTPKQRKRVYTALHQTHLPKMDRLGVVDYDNDRGTVTLTDHVEEFDIYLDVVASDDLPWSQFYLALGGVLTALVGVAALGVPPFSFVGGFGYALFVALAFVTVAGFHTLRDRRSLVGTTDAPPEVCPPPKEATGNWADD
jgi:hypothetical protein